MKVAVLEETNEYFRLLSRARSNDWLDINIELISLTPHYDEIIDGQWDLDYDGVAKLLVDRELISAGGVVCHCYGETSSEAVDCGCGTIFFINISLCHKEMVLPYVLWVIQRLAITIFMQCLDDACCFGENAKTFPDLTSFKDSLVCQECQSKVGKLFPKEILRLLFLTRIIETSGTDFLTNNFSQSLKSLGACISDPSLRNFVSSLLLDTLTAQPAETLRWLGERAAETYEEKNTLEDSYISKKRSLPKAPFIITNKHWNSWTPAKPSTGGEGAKSKSRGGGCLISDGVHFVAVDPGFGFLDLVYENFGITAYDLDAVVISHDHPDHSAALPELLALRFVYADKTNSTLRMYLNPSSHYLFERLLSYYSVLLDNESWKNPISSNSILEIGDIQIKSMAMCHKEIFDFVSDEVKDSIGSSEALGFNVKIDSEGTAPVQIILPGDTSFPNPEDVYSLKELAKFYKGTSCFGEAVRPDIAVLHIGSLEKGWIECQVGANDCPSTIRYGKGKHLGLNGLIRFLNVVQPKVIAVSEYGEELSSNDMRLSLNEILKEFLIYTPENILPADAELILVAFEDAIWAKCSCSEDNLPFSYIPIRKVVPTVQESGYISYSFPSGCKSGLLHKNIDCC